MYCVVMFEQGRSFMRLSITLSHNDPLFMCIVV